jgi:hypothetical protein
MSITIKLKVYTLRRRRCRIHELFLSQDYRGSKYCPSALRVSLFAISETLLCSMSALLLDGLQLLVLFVGTLTYWETKLFRLVLVLCSRKYFNFGKSVQNILLV